MMNVLVAYASKHGSTREIAEVIATDLILAGLDVEVRDIDDVRNLDDYDAVILGSAIYVGQWQKGAVDFVDRFADDLRNITVWLFSSGPIGDELFPVEDPPATVELVQKSGARQYRNFPGKLDRANRGFGERLVARLVRAPEGDFRNWGEIHNWTDEIAGALHAIPVREIA